MLPHDLADLLLDRAREVTALKKEIEPRWHVHGGMDVPGAGRESARTPESFKTLDEACAEAKSRIESMQYEWVTVVHDENDTRLSWSKETGYRHMSTYVRDYFKERE